MMNGEANVAGLRSRVQPVEEKTGEGRSGRSDV